MSSLHAPSILRAAKFAARHHHVQTRKQDPTIYVLVHLLEVAELLADLAFPEEVIVASILHDVVEDTPITLDHIASEFGHPVAKLVEELTDDPALDEDQQKQAQIKSAPHKSHHAKAIKLSDKISNLRAVIHQPPGTWSHTKRAWYLDWSRKVAAGLKGSHPALDQRYDEVAAELEANLATTRPID